MATNTEAKWFTKTIARNEITTLTETLIDNGDISPEIAKQFIDLFASKRKGGGATTTIKVDGVIVGKKCSVLGRYLPIEDFGTVGKDEEGNVKYSYQSKEGAKLMRAKKSEFEEAINTADLELEETEDIQAWKTAKIEAKEIMDAPIESEEGFETEEDFVASL